MVLVGELLVVEVILLEDVNATVVAVELEVMFNVVILLSVESLDEVVVALVKFVLLVMLNVEETKLELEVLIDAAVEFKIAIVFEVVRVKKVEFVNIVAELDVVTLDNMLVRI